MPITGGHALLAAVLVFASVLLHITVAFNIIMLVILIVWWRPRTELRRREIRLEVVTGGYDLPPAVIVVSSVLLIATLAPTGMRLRIVRVWRHLLLYASNRIKKWGDSGTTSGVHSWYERSASSDYNNCFCDVGYTSTNGIAGRTYASNKYGVAIFVNYLIWIIFCMIDILLIRIRRYHYYD